MTGATDEDLPPGATAPAGTPAPAETTEQDALHEASASRPWIGRLGLSVGIGATAAAASFAGIRIDHLIEEALRSRGVPMPRLVMGLGTGVLSVAVEMLDGSDASEDEDEADAASRREHGEPSPRP